HGACGMSRSGTVGALEDPVADQPTQAVQVRAIAGAHRSAPSGDHRAAERICRRRRMGEGVEQSARPPVPIPVADAASLPTLPVADAARLPTLCVADAARLPMAPAKDIAHEAGPVLALARRADRASAGGVNPRDLDFLDPQRPGG